MVNATLQSGLCWLQQAVRAADSMQALKPQLHQKEEESEALLAQVTQEQADAQAIREAVAAEESDIAARTQETEVRPLPAHAISKFSFISMQCDTRASIPHTSMLRLVASHRLTRLYCMLTCAGSSMHVCTCLWLICRVARIRAVANGSNNDCKPGRTHVQAIRNDALSEVQEALPALRAAEEALNALNKTDIIEMKTFPKPPALVQLTMEGVCVLLGERADWETARRVRALMLCAST